MGILRLKCAVKNYDWGKYGENSEVYRLYAANCGEKDGVNEKAYAEFWMGTHDSGSSYVVKSDGIFVNGFKDETLKNWILEHPFVLGDKVLEKWGCDLPILFKVLSVAKPLSIQAHPCKKLAEKLHLKYPTVYKDGNHKPEMALAITKFEILGGFISIEDLKKTLDIAPEISQLVDSTVIDRITKITSKYDEEEAKSALKQLFTQIMSASDNAIANVLSQLISRLQKKDMQFPGDVGVLAAFLMNYVTLNLGEAVCLGANVLHAYLSGDCIECMASSDNVVRASLTPKQRDVKTLCEMLTYKQGRPEILKGLTMEGSDGCTKRYCPPFEEFEVYHCDLSSGRKMVFPAVDGPSLFLVTQGNGTVTTGYSVEKIRVGDVLFAPTNTKLTILADTWLDIYRAGVNSKLN